MNMPRFKLDAVECAWCNARHELAVNTSGDTKPGPGDLSFCFSCGEWSVFKDDGPGVRKPTDTEFESIAHDVHATRLRTAWLNSPKGRAKYPDHKPGPGEPEIIDFDNLAEQMTEEVVDRAFDRMQDINSCLHGLGGVAQGVILGFVVAQWLAGFPDDYRESAFAHFIEGAKEQSRKEEKAAFGKHGHPFNRGNLKE